MCRVTNIRPTIDERGWYNITDTIKILGISRTTFWRKRKAGLISGKLRKIDNNYWFSGKEILAFFDASK